jgi:hypothetical protein
VKVDKTDPQEVNKGNKGDGGRAVLVPYSEYSVIKNKKIL